ncbi:Glu/Leu/Phe/Val dehydrogenase, partial [Acinetobacter baumannii]
MGLQGATAVVQGFGNVGSFAALELYKSGVKVISVSDRTGALHLASGLDIPSLARHCAEYGSLRGYSRELEYSPEDVLTLAC